MCSFSFGHISVEQMKYARSVCNELFALRAAQVMGVKTTSLIKSYDVL